MINVENSSAWLFFPFRILWIESSKEQHLFKISILYNIINVFTVTFDQFKAFLLNKSINIFWKYSVCIWLKNNFMFAHNKHDYLIIYIPLLLRLHTSCCDFPIFTRCWHFLAGDWWELSSDDSSAFVALTHIFCRDRVEEIFAEVLFGTDGLPLTTGWAVGPFRTRTGCVQGAPWVTFPPARLWWMGFLYVSERGTDFTSFLLSSSLTV